MTAMLLLFVFMGYAHTLMVQPEVRPLTEYVRNFCAQDFCWKRIIATVQIFQWPSMEAQHTHGMTSPAAIFPALAGCNWTHLTSTYACRYRRRFCSRVSCSWFSSS